MDNSITVSQRKIALKQFVTNLHKMAECINEDMQTETIMAYSTEELEKLFDNALSCYAGIMKRALFDCRMPTDKYVVKR